MFRYRLIAYYEEKATEACVAQTLVVIAENDSAAIQAAKAEVASDAVGSRVPTIKVFEKLPITPGVVFRSDPYIPFQWPGAKPILNAGLAPPAGR